MAGHGNPRGVRRRRIWCETLPLGALPLDLLEAHDLAPLVAVRPWDLEALAGVVDRCAARRLPVAVWPMLADSDGRWANADDMSRFTSFAREVRRVAPRAELVVDLEPAIAVIRRALRLGPVAFLGEAFGRARAFEGARAELTTLVDEARSDGVPTSAAVLPSVLFDGPTWPWTQALLGTPSDGVLFDHVSVMLYPSILEGWSAGLLDRRRTVRALRFLAGRTRARFGARAGVSLGVVGPGALGNEPCYRDPAELEEDVAATREAGVDDLCLFDLGGVVRRGEAFVTAFTGCHLPGRALG